MLDCQHIQPIGQAEKLPYYYLRLSPQPLHIYYQFLPKHTHRSSIGNVTITIRVAGRYYGPYTTDITTTTNVWIGRDQIRPTKYEAEIGAKLKGLQAVLEKAWYSLLELNQPITGEMILTKAGLVPEKGGSHE